MTEDSYPWLGHVRRKTGAGHSGDLHIVSGAHGRFLVTVHFDKHAIAPVLHKKEAVDRIEIGHHSTKTNRVCALCGALRQLVYLQCVA